MSEGSMLLDNITFLEQLMYVLITDTYEQNKGLVKHIRLMFSWLTVAAAVLGHVCLAVMFGDQRSGEIFTVVDHLGKLPPEQHYDLETQVVQLVGSDTLQALRQYISKPEQYSKLMTLLKSQVQKQSIS